jgi:6-phosphogluconate dehydrogenase
VSTHEIGLIGLAVMGENLALNIARHGFPIAVYNRTTDKTTRFVAERVKGEPVHGAITMAEFAKRLARPRRVIVMVKAGAPVDATIAELAPHLDRGDLVVDAGNSHPRDTERRVHELAARGLRFVGMGVSGGEDGALNGPSLMPGGTKEDYAALAPVLTRIAAKVDDGPCVAHIGPGAAGHFVKMVHNGIEYGDMQLIAEAYDLLSTVLGMPAAAIADVFAEWNRGPLESYLVEITSHVLRKTDPETGRPMIDVIVDRAGQKGTGRWTIEQALELGVPVPTIEAAVQARGLSARKEQRVRAAELLRGPTTPRVDAAGRSRLVAAIRDALWAAKVCSYAQGFDLMRTASEQNRWSLDLGELARIWKGGCIIRAGFLGEIKAAYAADPELPNLLLDPSFRDAVNRAQSSWRQVVALAAAHGVPVLAIGSSLSYFDSYRRARLPQSLTQAQRDYFGAHTYERVDRPAGEFFHTEW